MTAAADLRYLLRSHNRSIVLASLIAAILSTVGWAVLYGLAYWIVMLIVTVKSAGNAALPASFNPIFLGISIVLMALTWLDTWLFPEDKPADERPTIETVADIAYFLPRVTLSVLQNFGAYARLRRCDLPAAESLFTRLLNFERIPLHSLPLSIPDERSRDHILRAFLSAEIARLHSSGDSQHLRIRPIVPWSLAARAEKSRRVKSHANDTDSQLAHMRRATVLENEDPLPRPEDKPALRDRD